MNLYKLALVAFCLVAAPQFVEAQSTSYSASTGGIHYNSSGQGFRKVLKTRQVDCGYGRYCTQQYYVWEPVSQVTNVYNVTPKTKNWRDYLASYAGAIKLEQQNHEDFLATVDALGLTDYNAYAQQSGSYGQANLYSQYGAYYAPQGETAYQLRYSALSELTKRADPAVAINQMGNHIKGMQEILREANSGMQATVQMDVVGRNHAANTVANALAAATATDSLANLVEVIGKSDRGQDLTVKEIHTMIQAVKTMQQETLTPEEGAQVMADSVIRNSCVRCHSSDDAKGGIDLSTGELSLEEYQAVVVNATNGSMPPEGSDPLTAEQKSQLVQELQDNYRVVVE